MSGEIGRQELARVVAGDIPDGAYVNLGIGAPTLVANFLPDDLEIVLHTENGLLGMGPAPEAGLIDPDLINAGKRPVTSAYSAPSRYRHLVIWPTGPPVRPARSLRSAAQWTWPSAPKRSLS